MQLKAAAATVPSDWCATTPTVRFAVNNNSFAFAMPHPNIPGNATVNWSVYIDPDGSLHGQAGADLGQMTGRVTGTRMDGLINGSGCEYTFTADRA